MNTDGGSRGNPGPAAIAAVITEPGDGGAKPLDSQGMGIGEATNNVAEYRALLLGIGRAGSLGAKELEIRCDSELVVRQVKGDYKVKDDALKDLHEQVLAALGNFAEWSISHVPREENEAADALVNEALDS